MQAIQITSVRRPTLPDHFIPIQSASGPAHVDMPTQIDNSHQFTPWMVFELTATAPLFWKLGRLSSNSMGQGGIKYTSADTVCIQNAVLLIQGLI